MVEIFIEEAGEVLETINEYLPQWASDTENEDALKELRRAYHTLKGSGRMVGANVVGELAWSIENMLNRVLDHSIPASHAAISIVETVTGVVPSLVKSFETRTQHTINVEALAAVAADSIRSQLGRSDGSTAGSNAGSSGAGHDSDRRRSGCGT